ncbi:cytidine deaminase [Saccharicrinis aurantiacus]|uniref:cytidine deaminase n=1 Tax=Saccharicrinis aurantiacus TaxID=1849719 RepID=UPI0008390EC0|nr:cytidine deaminase [Saccharicrinis aurantiacus]
MKKIEIVTSLIEVDDINELTPQDQELITSARAACHNAYAPYSKFSVGAAVRLANGKVITGNNQENAAYPSGLCAERTAIFWANSQFPDIAVETIAISVLNNGKPVANPIAPCGSCRQVMLETENRFETPLRVIMDSESKIIVSKNTVGLLPLSFSAQDLEL